MSRSSPDWVEYNRVSPSRGHKTDLFQVWCGSGQDITGHYRIGVPKTLPRRTLVAMRQGLLCILGDTFSGLVIWSSIDVQDIVFFNTCVQNLPLFVPFFVSYFKMASSL